MNSHQQDPTSLLEIVRVVVIGPMFSRYLFIQLDSEAGTLDPGNIAGAVRTEGSARAE